MADILSDFLTAEVVPVPSIIGRGILPRNGKLIIGGEPKSNKSFFVLNLALSVARGEHVFGATYKSGAPVMPVTRPHRVLYIEQEIGEQELRKRLQQLTHGLDMVGVELYIKTRDTGMRLDTDEGRAAIYREVEQVRPHLTILDPLIKFHLSNENSAQEMGAVMRVGDHIISDFDTALIHVHHVARETYDNPRRGGAKLRGSTAIFADVDTFMGLTRKSTASSREPTLEVEFELRCGEPIENMYFKRLIDGRIVYLGDQFRWGERAGQTSTRKPQAPYGNL